MAQPHLSSDEKKLRQFETEVEAARQAVNAQDSNTLTKSIGDPAEPAHIQAAHKADRDIDEVTDPALGFLRDLRDKLDDMIRAIVESRNMLKRDVERQSDLAAQAIDLSKIVGGELDKLTDSVARSLERPVARTITQTKQRNGR